MPSQLDPLLAQIISAAVAHTIPVQEALTEILAAIAQSDADLFPEWLAHQYLEAVATRLLALTTDAKVVESINARVLDVFAQPDTKGKLPEQYDRLLLQADELAHLCRQLIEREVELRLKQQQALTLLHGQLQTDVEDGKF